MKKLLNKLLVLALLVLVPTVAVNAVSGTNDNSGSITINDAIVGKTYSAYQILKLESYDTDKGAYTYKIATGWESFIKSDTIKGVYVNVNSENIVTWIDTKKTESDMKTFAQLALEYAKKNKLNSIAPSSVEGTTVKFTGLNLGYYLVDSSVGALCSLTTTKPDATAEEKNSVPTVIKEVKENSDNQYHASNTDYIGKTIYFKTTITAGDGAQDYVLYDKMSVGLTFDSNSIKVYTLDTNNNEVEVANTNYTVSTTTDGYTFVITFNKSFTDTLKAGDKIIVKYTAVLNENAVVGSAGNPNDTYLTYGDSTDTTNKTPESETKTYTYSFDLVKTDSSNVVLTGAKFKLYDAVTGGNEIKVVWDASKNAYRVAKNGETGVEIEVTGDKLQAGKIVIIGLDNGTYYLEETKAPNGYNKLTSRVSVVINNANLDATTSSETTRDDQDKETTTIKYVRGGVHVTNYTGSELPTTGGMGTILFITIGSLMVIGFGVLLVTKLRISKTNA